jgi:hypothetical protein
MADVTFYVDGREAFTGSNWRQNIPRVGEEFGLHMWDNYRVCVGGEYTGRFEYFVVDRVVYNPWIKKKEESHPKDSDMTYCNVEIYLTPKNKTAESI